MATTPGNAGQGQMPGESLLWVSRELGSTLGEMRDSLERYADDTDRREHIKNCAELMHVAQGALRMVEVHGAALLVEEMEAVANALFDRKIRSRKEALDALMRALVQLPTYLDRILGGGRDIPLVLLPLLNDLRAVRGSPLLSESTLFVLNFASDEAPSPDSTQASGEDIGYVARRLRPHYQAALLGWLRGDNAENNLATMGVLAENLQRAASSVGLFQLWWVVGAIVEALAEDGLEPSAAIKRLLGQADRQIKRLIDQGETVFDEAPPRELLNNLLYYIARATSGGERVQAIKTSFSLAHFLPAEAKLEQARANLAAPSASLMTTVGEAIKQDLAEVKDVLDIHVRTGQENVAELAPQNTQLKKVADTLGVLGLGDLRARVEGQRDALDALIESSGVPDQGALLGIAATLLSVEDALDGELLDLIRPDDQTFEDTMVRTGTQGDREFHKVSQAVLRECKVNLSRIKDAIALFAAAPEQRRVLDAVPELLNGINAGLMMLERERAMNAVQRVGEYLCRDVMAADRLPALDQIERLADAIVSIEYYMETLHAGRSDPWYMLDNAEACLDTLEAGRPRPAVSKQTPPQTEIEAPAADPLGMAGDGAVADAGGLAVVDPGQQSVDPELLELFIEEAKEEIDSLTRRLPSWRAEPDNRDHSLAVRRVFHTLKGSGRMVHAESIAEFGRAFEALLNGFINGAVKPEPQFWEAVDGAAAMLPHLVEQLEAGTPPPADPAGLMQQALALAGESEKGSQYAGADSVADVSDTARDDVASDEPQSTIDPALFDIFRTESAAHLDAVADYVQFARTVDQPQEIPEAVHRAWHTLHGAASTAGFGPAEALAAAADRLVGAAYRTGSELNGPSIDALAGAVGAMRELVIAVDSESVASVDNAALIAQIDALTPAVRTGIQPVVLPYDAEIAQIFTEESRDLLAAADEALQAWSGQNDQPEALAELQRHLHTIKGGARMAGLSGMGTLSHELESLLTSVSAGEMRADRTVVDTAQQALDELFGMRQAILAGGPLPDPARMLAQIAGLSRPVAEEAVPAPGEPEPEQAGSAPEPQAAAADGAPSPVESVPAESLPADSVPAESVPIESEAAETGPERIAPAEIVQPAGIIPPSPAQATPSPVSAVLREDTGTERQEVARVDADLLNDLLNHAGEVSIFRSRLEQQITAIGFNLGEFSQTVVRLRDQIRKLEGETEAQIRFRHQEDGTQDEQFDPLELDRYSTIQQLSRALAESVNDLTSIQELLEEYTHESESLLVQQSRVATELQDGLMRTRMVPFARHQHRLARIVRQAAMETGRRAELQIDGGSGELDRQVLDRMLAPFEHMLRNSVIHGIESPDERRQAGKPETATIKIELRREGSEMKILISDDGRGMDVGAIKDKARDHGLIDPGETLADSDTLQLILEPGFSTASAVTQSAGRGVGMDVVANEVRQLGGSLDISSTTGQGATIAIRLPFTLAITQSLLVTVGEETYAIPLPAAEGIVRIARSEAKRYLADDAPKFIYGGQGYRFQHLSQLLGDDAVALPRETETIPVILVRAGEHSTALVVEQMLGSREVVVKSVGPQIASIRGVSGATILGDGSIVVILDISALVRTGPMARRPIRELSRPEDHRLIGLVVDDSITVRRVTRRLLERNGMRVLTAKDGVDAIALLQETRPDFMLLDIEMPRMDGYEVIQQVRNDKRLHELPIIMITSRVGDKHQRRAQDLGVSEYLGKPYQEAQLLAAIAAHVKTASVRDQVG